MDLSPLISFELRYICQPLFVRPVCVKLMVQQVLGEILRRSSLSGTSVVVILHRKSYISSSTYPHHSLVIHMDAIIMPQIIIQSSIAFVWIFHVDFFNLIRQLLVFHGFSARPFVISRARHMKQCAGLFHSKALFPVTLLTPFIDLTTSYFRRHLSSLFRPIFSRAFSISDK